MTGALLDVSSIARDPGMPQVCVCYLVRPGTDGSNQVLLGRKKKGLGLGKYVAPGGKLEPGEAVLDAMVREVREEVGLTVHGPDLVPLGLLTYLFPHRPSWSQQSSVFLARTWDGVEEESNELAPEWFSSDALPLQEMWNDAQHWLLTALAGTPVVRTFTFAADLETVVK